MQLPITIPDSIIFDSRLTLGDIKVYCALVKIAAGLNQCIAAKKQIALISDMDRVCRYTKNLQSHGYIKITRSKPGEFNTYYLPHIVASNKKSPSNQLRLFAGEYLKYSTGIHTPATIRTYKSCLNELILFAGDIPLKEINIMLIERFLSHKRLVSPYTARRHYISLKSIFERAVVWGLIDGNPFRKIRQPKVPEVEVAYFKQHELQNLLLLIKDDEFRELVLVAFYSSLRRGELLSLRWRDIDLTQGVIQIRNSGLFTTKTGRNRTIGVCSGLHVILSRRKEKADGKTELVFTNGNGQALNGNWVTKEFKKYIRIANLDPRLRWHSLRHSGASLMLAMGAPAFAVQKHLGHQRLQTTERYSHAPVHLLIQTANVLPTIYESDK